MIGPGTEVVLQRNGRVYNGVVVSVGPKNVRVRYTDSHGETKIAREPRRLLAVRSAMLGRLGYETEETS